MLVPVMKIYESSSLHLKFTVHKSWLTLPNKVKNIYARVLRLSSDQCIISLSRRLKVVWLIMIMVMTIMATVMVVVEVYTD